MRKIESGSKIEAQSLLEIKRGVRDEAERLGDQLKIRVEGDSGQRRPTVANTINWWACWMLTQPLEVRNRIAVEGKAIFDAHAQSDEPVAFGVPTIRNRTTTLPADEEHRLRKVRGA